MPLHLLVWTSKVSLAYERFVMQPVVFQHLTHQEMIPRSMGQNSYIPDGAKFVYRYHRKFDKRYVANAANAKKILVDC